jgi:hypothetical protein
VKRMGSLACRYVPSTAILIVFLALLCANFFGSSATVTEASSLTRNVESSHSLRSRLRLLEGQARRLESMVEVMEQSATRFRQWMGCISRVPVSEYGDQDHRFGFVYDERDGTQIDLRPALAVDDQGRRHDYTFLAFAHRDECQSDTTKPGTPGSPGTADPARVVPDTPETSVVARIHALEMLVADLWTRAEALNRMSERFDEWESCLSDVPVTEYGDPAGQYGYLFSDGNRSGYMPALTVDISEWDDPDYMFSAFVGRDLPFRRRECGHEPGESVD